MAEMYIGQLLPFAGKFVINGTAAANGALIPINQNSALFSLLGTTYGGNGIQNFALPDLRGRFPVGFGTGPNLSPYTYGQAGGTESSTLSIANLPPHNHPATTSGLAVNTSGLTVNTSGLTATLKAAPSNGDSSDPTGNPLGQVANGFVDGGAASVAMAASSITVGGSASIGGTASVSGNVAVGVTGSGVPIPLINPYLTINWLVVLQGLFPTQQ